MVGRHYHLRIHIALPSLALRTCLSTISQSSTARAAQKRLSINRRPGAHCLPERAPDSVIQPKCRGKSRPWTHSPIHKNLLNLDHERILVPIHGCFPSYPLPLSTSSKPFQSKPRVSWHMTHQHRGQSPDCRGKFHGSKKPPKAVSHLLWVLQRAKEAGQDPLT